MQHTITMSQPNMVQRALRSVWEQVQAFKAWLLVALILSIGAVSQAQSASIDIDTDTFINAINQWLPLALTITAIGVGIAGGFKLAMFIGRMLINAFDGRL